MASRYSAVSNASSIFPLRNGLSIPCIGFGTVGTRPGGHTATAVAAALEAGYRYVDAAAIGRNERDVARGIQLSGIPREDIYVSSKLWNTSRGYDGAMRAFEKTLRELRTDYLDMYLIHWPANEKNYGEDWKRVNQDTWRAFEKLYEDGSVRVIGVCNFKPHHLEALTGNIAPFVDQIEFHPGSLQSDTRAYCRDHSIRVCAWAPLASGRLLKVPILTQVADIYGKTVPQLILRWCLQHQALPVVRSADQAHITADLNIFDFAISPEDMRRIDVMRHVPGSGLDPDELVEPDRHADPPALT